MVQPLKTNSKKNRNMLLYPLKGEPVKIKPDAYTALGIAVSKIKKGEWALMCCSYHNINNNYIYNINLDGYDCHIYQVKNYPDELFGVVLYVIRRKLTITEISNYKTQNIHLNVKNLKIY